MRMGNTYSEKGILKKTNVKLRALSHRNKSRSVKHKKIKVGERVRHQNRRAGIDEPGHPRRDAGMRSGKAGCRIPTDLKRGNGGEGTAQRRFCWPGAGGVGGAAGSAPDTFAVTEAAVDEKSMSERNPSTIQKGPRCPKRTEPFHRPKGPAAKANGTFPPYKQAPASLANVPFHRTNKAPNLHGKNYFCV